MPPGIAPPRFRGTGGPRRLAEEAMAKAISELTPHQRATGGVSGNVTKQGVKLVSGGDFLALATNPVTFSTRPDGTLKAGSGEGLLKVARHEVAHHLLSNLPQDHFVIEASRASTTSGGNQRIQSFQDAPFGKQIKIALRTESIEHNRPPRISPVERRAAVNRKTQTAVPGSRARPPTGSNMRIPLMRQAALRKQDEAPKQQFAAPRIPSKFSKKSGSVPRLLPLQGKQFSEFANSNPLGKVPKLSTRPSRSDRQRSAQTFKSKLRARSRGK